jgi:hypothetical protein
MTFAGAEIENLLGNSRVVSIFVLIFKVGFVILKVFYSKIEEKTD